MLRTLLNRSLVVTTLGLTLAGCVAEAPEAEDVDSVTGDIDITIRPGIVVPPVLPCYSIDEQFDADGGAATFGAPTGAELATSDGLGTYRNYERGSIYRKRCALSVLGGLRDGFQRLGGPTSFLGWPNSSGRTRSDGVQYLGFDTATILYTAPTGAHEIHGSIKVKWLALGGFTSRLGVPLTDETATPGGRYNDFQRGSIYWSPATGALEIEGAIRDKWRALGAGGGFLGFPVTDETATADGVGRFNHFEGGSIFWSGASGAWSVKGSIRDKWNALGGVSSSLGYPVSDEMPSSDGTALLSRFQHGTICYTGTDGAVVKELGASCNKPAPACTPTSWSFCCVGSVREDLTKTGCTRDEARHKFETDGPHCAGFLYDTSCASACTVKDYCFRCAGTYLDVAGQGCFANDARPSAFAHFAAYYGMSCSSLEEIACY
jgi:uncharacterized protein with LGFP repeats